MNSEEQSNLEMNAAIKLFSSGKFQKALEVTQALSKKSPRDSLLHNIMGACYAGLGQLSSAVKSYEIAINLDPNYAKAFYNLGDTYLQLKNYEESIKCYEKSLEIDPYYVNALSNLGNVLRENDQLDNAIEAYEKALKIDPNSIIAHSGICIVLNEMGKLEHMIEHLHAVIKLKPDFSEAHNNLGNTLRELGRLGEAVDSYQKALEVNSEFSEVHNNLGNAFIELGYFGEAVESYQKALKINPDYPALHNNLGNAFKELGRFDDALKSYHNALSYNPDYPDSLNNLGIIFSKMGELEQSVQYYKRAISKAPDFEEAYVNLGNVLNELNHFDEAVHFYNKAIEINPNSEHTYNNLGLILLGKDDFLDKAVKSFEKAIQINPNFAAAYNNIAQAFRNLQKPEKAVESYKKAIEINPSLVVAYNNLGNILATDFNKLDEAALYFEKAIEINPNFAEAFSNLGNVMRELDHLDEALNCYERANNLQPNLDNILGNILRTKMEFCNWDNLKSLITDLKQKIINNEKVINPFVLLALIDNSALQLKVAELMTNVYHPKRNLLPVIENHPKSQKIKIGYFSAGFSEHLTTELYEMHNRDHFEIHAFSFGKATNDEMNLRIKAGVDQFHEVQAMTHQDITELARSFKIDIAVDLAGHTLESRTDIFAMSVAPIQLSYIGYLGSMGAEYYDYLIADPVMIPKESQKYYMEKIVYLPSFQVNDSKDLPPNIVMTRKDVGLPDKGFVFCCFNNTYKITPTTFDSWARILKAVEDSVLIIFANNELSKANLTKEIKKRGVAAERLIFGDSVSRPEYLARFKVADLFLDTQPYNAGTTASDALKMGLPMLTIKGEAYQARMGASIVNALNLPELITTSSKEYESLAIELAKNPEKLNKIKEKLQNNLSTAPLFDTPLFTKNLESAYTQMYERYHKGLEPDHIFVE